MKYVGIVEQQRSNKIKSIFILCLFPILVSLTLCALVAAVTSLFMEPTLELLAIGIGGGIVLSAIWYWIAYCKNLNIIRKLTGSKSITRKDNPRVFNIVENLCIAAGMKVCRVDIMETDAYNAFASGVDDDSYTITLTRGMMRDFNDEEIAGVVGHELTHIINNDTRLQILSIITLDIILLCMKVPLKIIKYTFLGMLMFLGIGGSREDGEGGNSLGCVLQLVVFTLAIAIISRCLFIVCVSIFAYIISFPLHFLVSRQREYLADAGSVELNRGARGLCSALEKIADEAALDNKKADGFVAQLYIETPVHKSTKRIKRWFQELFSTHPDIQKRIAFLKNL